LKAARYSPNEEDLAAIQQRRRVVHARSGEVSGKGEIGLCVSEDGR
jgi:hypothetical protein